MIDLTDIEQVKGLQSNLRVVFESEQGKHIMKFMEQIGGWSPSHFDSMETNAIISRDANRRMIGTLRTLLDLTAEQIVATAKQGG